MNSINSNYSTSFFRHFADAFSAPRGKSVVGTGATGNELRSAESSRPVRIRDEFTLSHQGRVAYEKYVSKTSKLDETGVATPAAQVIETPRIFSTAPESVDNLIQFLGLDTINGNDTTLAGALNLSLESEIKTFSDKLTSLLQEVGVEINDETDLEITFAMDTEGNIVIEGNNLTDEQKTKLAELINDDPEMVEQIKNLSAKLQVVNALENDIDLSSDSLDWAKNQLLSNFLQREGGFSLTDVALRIDPDTGVKSLFQQDKNGNEVKDSLLPTLLAKMPGLEGELLRSLESPGQPTVPSGNAAPLLKMSNGTVSGIVTNSLQDVGEQTLAIKGLEEYEKVTNFQLFEPQKILDLESFRPKEILPLNVAFERHSKHLSPIAWALGIDTSGKSMHDANNFLFAKDGAKFLRNQLQTNQEKIDDKITGILKANNIVLGAEETLNLKVNQRGEITVGDGISTGKREKIEKLLNEDKKFAQDLLFTHAERKFAVMGDYPKTAQQSDAKLYILTDAILRREYGVSLDDFQKGAPGRGWTEDGWDAGRSVVAKDGNNDILDKIRNEERVLYSYIENSLNHLHENGGDFEVSFSYKNGVTIEKGATDQSTLDKAAERFAPMSFIGFGAKCSVTIDPFGTVLNSQVTDPGRHSFADMTRDLKNYLVWSEVQIDNGVFPSQSRLQQYVFDSQRLFQFNTGVDTATAKAMNIAFVNAK